MHGRVEQAFTLVELVIVIAIVGILAAIAIPRFINIRTEAYDAQREGIIGSVRAGILTTASKNQVNGTASTTFPPDIEATWTGSGVTGGVLEIAVTPCGADPDACFELVIPGGYTNTAWSQGIQTGSAGSYETPYTYTHPVSAVVTTYKYRQTDGTFRSP